MLPFDRSRKETVPSSAALSTLAAHMQLRRRYLRHPQTIPDQTFFAAQLPPLSVKFFSNEGVEKALCTHASSIVLANMYGTQAESGAEIGDIVLFDGLLLLHV